MRYYSLRICVLFIFLIFCEVNGDISQITYLHEARDALEAADSNTLVLFDIDRILVIMRDQVLLSGKSGLKKKLQEIAGRTQPLTKEEQDYLIGIVLLKTSHDLVERVAVDIMHDLQKKNARVIAFSSSRTVPYGCITDIVK